MKTETTTEDQKSAVGVPRLVLAVDRDGWTNGLQLSIEDDAGGYRLKGPKYNGSSKRLLTAELSARDAGSIRRYLDKYFPSENDRAVPPLGAEERDEGTNEEGEER